MVPIPDANLQRINILLKEYDTLRSEIQQRTAAGFALGGVIVAALGWLLSLALQGHRYTFMWAAPCSVLALVYGAKFLDVQILNCAARVQRIEKRVNFLAQDYLLEWESRWSVVAKGHLGRAKFPTDLHPEQQFPTPPSRGGG